MAASSSPLELVAALESSGCLRKSVREGLLLYEGAIDGAVVAQEYKKTAEENEGSGANVECNGDGDGDGNDDGDGDVALDQSSWEVLRSKSYNVDDGWIKIAEAAYIVRCQILHAEQAIENRAFSTVTSSTSSSDGSTAHVEGSSTNASDTVIGGRSPPTATSLAPVYRILHLLKKARTYLLEKQRKFLDTLKSMERMEPRLVRLGAKHSWSEKEMQAVEYILMKELSQEDLGSLWKEAISSRTASIAAFAEMSTAEIFKFFDPQRGHVRDCLLPDIHRQLSIKDNTDVLDYYPSPDHIRFQFEVMKALIGKSLTEEEKLKLSNTALMDVLNDEEDNNGDGAQANQDAVLNEIMKRASESSFSAVGDIYELVKAEVERDRDNKLRNNAEDVDTNEEIEDTTSLDESPSEDQLAEKPPAGEVEKKAIVPYNNDLEYIEDNFKLLLVLLRLSGLRRAADNEDYASDDDVDYFIGGGGGGAGGRKKTGMKIRELQGKEKIESNRIARRLELTRQSGEWQPRMERLRLGRQLTSFEVLILMALVGLRLSPTLRRVSGCRGSDVTVGTLIRFFSGSLIEQIQNRKYFYKSATLIKEGILTVRSYNFSADLTDQEVDIDRRMLDFLVGLDTEMNELIEGSQLYYPQIKGGLTKVVCAEDQKKLIMETVQNFVKYRKVRKELGLDGDGYGNGLALLFHGESGVGKTMMANAIAHHLGKKILLINYPSLGQNEAGENIRFIFREAKINDALLFFDECESLFEDRRKGFKGGAINMLLTEIERHDGLMIMATNRPQDLDDAMQRRISMVFEFSKPDHLQRGEIWKSQLPSQFALADDVDVSALALKFELTGGLIKNAVQAALCKACARSSDESTSDVILTQADLIDGAQLQLRSFLKLKGLDTKMVPSIGLDDVILNAELKEKLGRIVNHEKARAILYGQWGFGKKHGNARGLCAMFSGIPGSGKTLAAEAIAYDLGKPVKLVNCAGILSKWVGETPKNIDKLFQQARASDSILIFDEAEGLFGSRAETHESSTDRYAAVDVGVLLHQVESYPGIIIFITNTPRAIDKAFHRRVRFSLEFTMPEPSLRAKLWRSLIPEEAPLDKAVDFESLGRQYALTGGSIRNAIFRAATKAALRPVPDSAITEADLHSEAKEEIGKLSDAAPAFLYG